jgi:hypothetical protein
MPRSYQFWSQSEDEFLRQLCALPITDEEVMQKFREAGIERNINSLQNRMRFLKLPSGHQRTYVNRATPPSPVVTIEAPSVVVQAPDPVQQRDPVEEERERQERIRSLRQEKDLLREIASERNLRAMLEGLFRELAPRLEPPPKYHPPHEPEPHATKETLLLHLSDWHYGERVDKEGTRGHNTYDTVIAADRAYAVTAGAISIANKMRRGRGWDFNRLVVAVNGDMVTGTIHELERHSDPGNIIWSTWECGELLAMCLRQLAAAFPKVDVYVTSGNHGRLPDARRMQSKDPTRNWDTVVALFAKAILSQVENVRIEIPNSYAVSYEIEGTTVLQSHGHDIKSWSGIPWYGINRFLGNYNGLEAARGGRIGAYLFGHFHSQTNITYPGGEAFVNGSLVGGSEWTINALGRSDRPCQMMLAFHPEYGVTHRWPIYAEADV